LLIHHHHVKFGENVEIGRIVFNAGIMEYVLGEEARVRVVLGESLAYNFP
jgi:hypothetical protein